MRHFVLLSMLLLFAGASACWATDWPQLQGNPQRTGYTPDSVAPPFRVAWSRDFQPERGSRHVQAVIYAGKVFVGSEYGNLYALGATDGKEAWRFTCGSPIMHTVACAD